MGRKSEVSIWFEKAVQLIDLENNLIGELSPKERRKIEAKLKRINRQFTNGKTAKAHHGWRRPFLTAVMKLYPSMVLPPLPRLLEHPEIKAVIALPDVPSFWKISDSHIIDSFRDVLKKYKFSLVKIGRPKQ